MCGGDPSTNSVKYLPKNFSPHVRGVILLGDTGLGKTHPFPRMCGGDPYTASRRRIIRSFSPHVRG